NSFLLESGEHGGSRLAVRQDRFQGHNPIQCDLAGPKDDSARPLAENAENLVAWDSIELAVDSLDVGILGHGRARRDVQFLAFSLSSWPRSAFTDGRSVVPSPT